MRLNLGCGRDIKPGWVNADRWLHEGVDAVCDLAKRFPWDPETVGEILLSHVLEHLPNPLHVMEECWRVAKPGAVCTIRVPHGASDDAWEDPTHVRPYFPQSFGYFSQPYYWRADYGYRADWQPETVTFLVRNKHAGANVHEFLQRVMHERNLVLEMVATLRKVSPIRESRLELMVLPTYRIEACAP